MEWTTMLWLLPKEDHSLMCFNCRTKGPVSQVILCLCFLLWSITYLNVNFHHILCYDNNIYKFCKELYWYFCEIHSIFCYIRTISFSFAMNQSWNLLWNIETWFTTNWFIFRSWNCSWMALSYRWICKKEWSDQHYAGDRM